MVTVENKAVLSKWPKIPRILNSAHMYLATRPDSSHRECLCPSFLPFLCIALDRSVAMSAVKKPDYILVLLYCVVYLEVAWLIVMVWHSCN